MPDNNAPKAVLELVQGLTIVIVAGGLGGLVYGVAALVDGGRKAGGKYHCVHDVPVPLFLLSKGLVGVGGGMAALLAALTVGRYLEPPKSTDLLSLVGLCFVAGYIGHRILPAVAARLERDLAETKNEVAETKNEVAETKKEVAETKKEVAEAEQATIQLKNQINMGLEVSRAQQILAERQNATTNEVERIRGTLEGYRNDYPLDRSLAIVLGRLYMWILHDRDSAIRVLREFIDHKKRANLLDRDVSDAWFNIGCYTCTEVEGKRDAGWEDDALAALKVSIAINPSNAADAVTDKDFEPLRASKAKSAFEALTAVK